MLKVTVKRSGWLRGHPNKSMLLRKKDGLMCCMGFACLAASVPVENIENKQLVMGIGVMPEPLKKFNNSEYAATIYRANDRYGMKDEDREAELIDLGKKVSIAFTFVP